ncbi:TPA: hypothetical protein RSW73_000243 [Vibrio cholerae]|nr:hypothetical protein [Vibrio cholerae]
MFDFLDGLVDKATGFISGESKGFSPMGGASSYGIGSQIFDSTINSGERSILGTIGDGLSKTSDWMEKNPTTTKLLGSGLIGVGGYLGQKQLMKQEMDSYKDRLNMENQMRKEWSAVPNVDAGYGNLTVSESPNLASGGILTRMKKKAG